MGGVVNKWEEDFEFMVKIKNLVSEIFNLIDFKIRNATPKVEEDKNRMGIVKKFKSESEIIDYLFEYFELSAKKDYDIVDVKTIKGHNALLLTFKHKKHLLEVPLIYNFHLDAHANFIEYEVWINTYVTSEIKTENGK